MATIPLKQLADLCHRVGTSYKAGVDVKTIWERETRNGSPAMRHAMRTVADRVAAGHTVAEGMQATNGYFPEMAVAVVEAGEKGGRLERSFELLSKHYETLVRFRREMASRLAWPILELVGAVVIIGLMILAMGWATSSAGGEPLDFLGFGWSTMQYFWAWVIFVVMSFGTLAVLVYGSKEGWFGEAPMQIARKIPLLGKTIQIFALSRFAWVLAAAYEAGMNTMRGVRLAFRATQNFYYQQFEDQVADDLQSGVQLTDALRATGAFPDDFMLHVDNGELTGNIPESMNRVAEEYTDQAEKNLSILAKVLFMVIFTIVALFIGFLIITLYMQYIGTFQQFALLGLGQAR
ncbi:MAG: type II secretion system F family protein [Pirellulaceae bacterium]